jgi:hypothetical protein
MGMRVLRILREVIVVLLSLAERIELDGAVRGGALLEKASPVNVGIPLAPFEVFPGHREGLVKEPPLAGCIGVSVRLSYDEIGGFHGLGRH